MKPVEPARLQAALGRVKERIRAQANVSMEARIRSLLEKLEVDAASPRKYEERLAGDGVPRQLHEKSCRSTSASVKAAPTDPLRFKDACNLFLNAGRLKGLARSIREQPLRWSTARNLPCIKQGSDGFNQWNSGD
jgi:hypothetical protein